MSGAQPDSWKRSSPTVTSVLIRVVRKLGEGAWARFSRLFKPRSTALLQSRPYIRATRNEPMVALGSLIGAKALGKLQHPNVVQVIDYGTSSDGTPYLVMEFLRGESLAKRLKTQATSVGSSSIFTVPHIGFRGGCIPSLMQAVSSTEISSQTT